MKRLFWIVLILSMATLCGAGVCLQAWDSLQARIAETRPVEQVKENVQIADPPPAIPQGRPRLVIDKTEHNFGVMAPLAEVEHVFVVRNQGTAPLELEQGPTTCKCTMSGLSDRSIMPGEEGRITLRLKPTEKEGPFHQTASIRTNDPDQRELKLRIMGSVRVLLGVEPDELYFGSVLPGAKETAEAFVYSQQWPRFVVAKTESSRAKVACSVEPADKEWLKRHAALAGYRLKITLPDDMPTGGPFSESLRIEVDPRDGAAPRQSCQIKLCGQVPGFLEISGEKIEFDALKLGVLQQGETIQEHLTLIVRGEPRRIAVQRIETRPEFLRVRVVPLVVDPAKAGVYRIAVEVPSDAPPCNFLASNHGEIVIVTDHPRVPRLRLNVQLAVFGSSRSH